MDVPLKGYKKDFEHSYAFGVFPTLELLEYQPRNAIKVLVGSRGARNEGVTKIEEMCARRRIPFELNDRAVAKLAPRENVYAIGVFRKYNPQLDVRANHVVLVNPSDMGNLGTIVRTMVGFDVTGLGIVRPGADIFDPKVVRASMGALFRLSFEYFDTFTDYQTRFKRSFYPFMTNGVVPLPQASFDPPFTLVFGNESSGLPESFFEIGTSVTILHSSNIDSLNLPTAVGIGLYEATKVES